MATLPVPLQAELLGRLILAALLGSVLGWERQLARHPAGLRTHMLVSLGAAAYTVAGAFGGWALLGAGVGTVEDPGRVAAQIITGIGFLGAGTIWRSSGEEGVVRGLTTAASIWVAAAIGMLTGYGLYVLAAGTALLSFTVLRLIKGVELAPRAISGAVASRMRRPAVRTPGGAYQPARAPAVMEAPPRAPVSNGHSIANQEPPSAAEAEVALAETPGAAGEGSGRRVARDRLHKKLRKGKKGRKAKRSDLPPEELDEISDAPDIPAPSSPVPNSTSRG
jgi:uncharacterized membrane protein YhiD involved in acid resistance